MKNGLIGRLDKTEDRMSLRICQQQLAKLKCEEKEEEKQKKGSELWDDLKSVKYT